MADLNRPDYGQVWASTGEKVAPDTVKMQSGWVQEMMPFQYENYLQARQDEAIVYLLQKGVPEYSSTQEYIANKSVVVYQGNLYMAIATVTNVLPTVTASWKRLNVPLVANGTVPVSSGGTGATTASEARTNLGLGGIATSTAPATNGIVVKDANDSLVARTITGTSGNITITNPDGVAGNINVNVGSNVAQLSQDSSWTSKGGIRLPSGSTGERGTEVAGKIRYNTTLQKFEGFDGTSWNALGASSNIEITTLSGNGVTTNFTLNSDVFSAVATDVYIGGIYQSKASYSVSGSTITFSEAPVAGVDNIQVLSRRVVDLGLSTATQVSIQDTTNLYTSSTVEGALREVGEKAKYVKNAILSFPDYASASAAAATLPDGQEIEAPNADGRISRFEVQSGALVFKDFAPDAIRMQSYTALRAYTGKAQVIDITNPGVAGRFYLDTSDTTTADNGGTVIVDGAGRRWERLFNGPIMVKWFGAKCNGVDDDTAPLQSSAQFAKSSRIALFGEGTCRITSTVDFREVFLELGALTINVDHSSGPGLLIGGNANQADNVGQSLYRVVRVSGVDTSDTPAIRAIGVKGQHIKVGRTPYFQVYATDLTDRSGYSSAYSTFELTYTKTLELKGQPGTLGWINENYFYLNRCHAIKFADGIYGHNHNKFIGGTMEGVGLIDLPVGSSNYFYGFRFERNISTSEKLTVNFGPNTNNNHIEVTWNSSPGFNNSIYGSDLLEMTDQGTGNTLTNSQEEYSDDVVLFSIGQGTGLLSCVNKQTVGYNAYTTDLVGVGAIQQNFNGTYRIMQAGARMYTQENSLVPLRRGDMFSYLSDKPWFRFLMRCYDANRKLITTRPAVDPVTWAGITWVPSQAAYSVAANSERRVLLAVDNSVVKYVQFDITTGTGTNGSDFDEFRFVMRRGKYASYGPRDYASFEKPKRKTTLQYNNDADIDMWRVAEGLECIRYDNKQRKVNTFRRERYILAVNGNVLSVVPLGVMVYWPGALLYYEDGAGVVQSVPLTAADNGTITVSGALPPEIVPGAKVIYVLTQTVTTP